MQSDDFSPKESMLLIESMINQAKNRISENGFLYILWGWVIFLCAIVHFLSLKFNWLKHPEIIWLSCWLVVIFQVIYLARQKKRKSIKTYSESIITYIWISFGICMGLIFFILSKTSNPGLINTFILVLYGIPTFL